jgi:hypothetical protein
MEIDLLISPRQRPEIILPILFIPKNLDVIIALPWMRNNPFELVDTISFMGDEPRSSWVWAHTVIAQSMIMHNGILTPSISHPRQRNSLTLPTIRLI